MIKALSLYQAASTTLSLCFVFLRHISTIRHMDVTDVNMRPSEDSLGLSIQPI